MINDKVIGQTQKEDESNDKAIGLIFDPFISMIRYIYINDWKNHMSNVINNDIEKVGTIIKEDTHLHKLLDISITIDILNKELSKLKNYQQLPHYRRRELYIKIRDLVKDIKDINKYIKENYSDVITNSSKVYSKKKKHYDD